MPGVEPVSLRERLEWYGRPAFAADEGAKSRWTLGFWNPTRDRIELF